MHSKRTPPLFTSFIIIFLLESDRKVVFRQDFRNLTGGEGGIRTLDRGLPYTPLAGERFQPLSHLSKKDGNSNFLLIISKVNYADIKKGPLHPSDPFVHNHLGRRAMLTLPCWAYLKTVA